MAGRPSVCRRCGALIGAGESACGQCGAPAPGMVARPPRPDRETLRFARAVLARPATFSILFLVANIFVYLLMSFSGGTENQETLRVFGAKYNSLINQGQWWRFVTPVFIHIGILHLLFNMYGLWILGPYVERLYGSAKFVFFWVATGVAGVVASYLTVRPAVDSNSLFSRFFFRTLDGPSAGASGALFGLIGVLFVFGIKFRHELPDGFKQAFGMGMLPTILINLFIGYAFPFIDNSAHVGGLLAGAALALVVDYKRVGPRGPVAIAWHALQIAALALVAVSFVMVVRRPAPPLPAVPVAAANDPARTALFLNAMGAGQRTFENLFFRGETSGAINALNALDRAPGLDQQSEDLRRELGLLILRARQFVLASGGPPRAAARDLERQEIALAYASWGQRFTLWLQLNGGKYGITINPPNQN